MKNFKKLFIIAVLFSILFLPMFAFASWWNPFSWNWNIFDRIIQTVILKKIESGKEDNKKVGDNIDNIATKTKEDNNKKDNQKRDEKQSIAKNAPYIKIISPNGEEKLQIGKTYQIKWDSAGYSSDSEISIVIFNNKKVEGLGGVAQTTNSGIYDWTISSAMDALDEVLKFGMAGKPMSEKFKMKIYVVNKNNQSSVDFSDNYFEIISPCIPKWSYDCYYWNECINGKQTRRAGCLDYNKCGENIPLIRDCLVK